MILPIFGTIRNTVKMAELNNKWEQKKKNGGKEMKKEMDPQMKQILQYKEDLKRMRESNQMASIDAKLNSGGILTPEEITYLQQKCPEKYKEYMDLKNEREAYKRQMEACKTKEDVEKLKLTKMNGFLAEAKSVKNNPNIPDGKKKELMEKILRRTMGVQDEYMAFVRSGKYKELPTEEELSEEMKEKSKWNEEVPEDSKEVETEDAVQEENNNEIPEENQGIENEGDLKQDYKGENIKVPSKKNKPEASTLLHLRYTADVTFQEIEVELKMHLKAYIP